MATQGPSDMERVLSVHNRFVFLGTSFLVQIPGLVAIILVILWTKDYKGGFAWGAENPSLAFNWHPVLMTVGMIYLYGNGALLYRVFLPGDYAAKFKVKIVHAITMASVFVFAVIGLQAAFDSHNLKNPPIPNMYTLHSWIGLMTVILFAFQLTSGFLVFLLPTAGPRLRAGLLPFHQYLGSSIFILAIAAAIMGILEKTIWSLKNYSELPGEGILVNCMGLMMVLFGMGITFLLSKFSKE